ncbi:MAG: glycosyltransferase [Microgenomates group bacterium]
MNYLIIIPFALPWNWSADYEKETAKQLAKKHTVVAFLVGEGFTLWQYIRAPRVLIQKINAHLYVYKPLYILPFQRFLIIRHINFRIAAYLVRLWIWCSPMRRKKKIYWSFSLQYAVFPTYFGPHYFSIYDCVDAFVTENPQRQVLWKRYEERILKESDLVLVNSKTLYAQKVHSHPHIVQTGEGLFSKDIFDAPRNRQEPSDIAVIPHPRITFIGTINNRLDFFLIKKLVAITPSYSYVFIGGEDPFFDGHTETDFSKEIAKLKTMPNCYFLGKKQKTEIPAYIGQSDVGFIPYDISLLFNKFCSPMKIQEYFYMGKPVLSTAIPEVTVFVPHVALFHTAPEGKNQLKRLLSTSFTKKQILQLRQIARNNSIAKKCRYVETVLQKHYVS